MRRTTHKPTEAPQENLLTHEMIEKKHRETLEEPPAARIAPDGLQRSGRMMLVPPKPTEKPNEDDKSEPLLEWLVKNCPDQVEL
jgi:hypothetical protein